MAYGTQITNADGTVWLNYDLTPLNMVQRIDATITTGTTGQVYQTNVPYGRPFMHFARMSVDGTGIGTVTTNSNGYWAIQINASRNSAGTAQAVAIRFYIFSNFVTNTSAYGINYYDGSGNLTWTAEMRPLQLYSGTVSATATQGTSIGAGFPCAVCPSFCSYWLALYQPGTPSYYLFMSGAWKAYGNTIQSFVVDSLQTTSSAGSQTWSGGNYYYIDTILYDY